MYCGKCSGVWLIVLGVLVAGNAWFGILRWSYAFALLLVVAGILSIVKPDCGCGGGCHMPMDAPVVRKKKR
jgi:hypothetical protein